LLIHCSGFVQFASYRIGHKQWQLIAIDFFFSVSLSCHKKLVTGHCTQGLLAGVVQMAEAEVPVYTTNEHFQGMDARNAEQTRAEMVSCSQSTCTDCNGDPIKLYPMAAQVSVCPWLDDLTSDHAASFLQHITSGYKHINATYTFLTCAANVPDPLLHTPPAISFLQPLRHVGKAMEFGMNAIL